MAAKKAITLHAGHNKKGKIACGASDYIDESAQARIMRKKIQAELKKLGITAYNTTVNDGKNQSDILTRIVKKCNAKDRKYDISLHFNACFHSPADGKSKGIEALVYKTGGDAEKIAKAVCNKVSNATGLTNRGVKIRTDLYFLKRTNKPAVLIEICFVDDQDDVKIYKANKDLIAKKIAKAIAQYV